MPWSIVTGAAWLPDSLAADVGEYIGPWPPPPPEWVPADAGEIDYYVGLPNTTLEDFADGTYPTAVGYSYRYRNPDLSEQHGTGGPYSTGGADESVVTPGSHLIVVWFDPDYSAPGDMPTPSVEPEAVVPSTLVAGCSGPVRGPGHWSDWQDEIEKHIQLLMQTVVLANGGEHSYTDSSEQSAALIAEVESFRSRAAAGEEASMDGFIEGPSVVSISYLVFGFNMFFEEFRNVDGDYEVTSAAGMNQAVITVDGTGYEENFDFRPDPLDDLIQGVDYDFIPDSSQFVEYEDDHLTLTGWDDWTAHVTTVDEGGRYEYASTHGFDHDYLGGFAPSVRVCLIDADDLTVQDILDSDDPGPLPSSSWPDDTRGTEIARYTAPTTDDADTTDRSFDDDLVIPLSSELGTTPIWTVAVQPSNMYEVSPLVIGDFVAPSVGSISSLLAQVINGSFEPEAPQVIYTQPRFRYWVPGELIFGGAEWHTLGGHFRTVGGGTLRINTPGAGWLPVLDGTA